MGLITVELSEFYCTGSLKLRVALDLIWPVQHVARLHVSALAVATFHATSILTRTVEHLTPRHYVRISSELTLDDVFTSSGAALL